MKIGIIDSDLLDKGTRHPNLALMKISGYYKELGHDINLITSYEETEGYDCIYMSKVFSYTKVPEKILSLPNLIIGGTGFFEDGGPDLNSEIEHHMPDYLLYKDFVDLQINQGHPKNHYSDYLDYSIGFTTRGCFRKCDFCVNKKYDRPFRHSEVSEFLDPQRPYIYLWDDNFLAFNEWEKVLDELETIGKPFQFRQGLDIRLMTDRMAERLSKTHYHGDFIFAFDYLKDKDLIERKIKLWRRYSARTTKLYVLCAFESQDEADIISTFERIRILMSYGCLPYIMRYQDYKNSDLSFMYTQLARWCNQPKLFKKKSFRQFCEANQDYHKNKDTICIPYKTMLDFEEKYPETAKKYFDLRFEEENIYKISYGYGRKYSHKLDCATCSNEQKQWIDAFLGRTEKTQLLKDYFSREIDLQCLVYKESECQQISIEKVSDWFCDVLLDLSWDDLWQAIGNLDKFEEISNSNIPQFSNLYDAIFEIPRIVSEAGIPITYEDMGYYLNKKSKNQLAQRKYGENHSKFATLLDLSTINAPNNIFQIYTSVFGKSYISKTKEEQLQLASKLMFRIPIIQNLFLDAKDSVVEINNYLTSLSNTTARRRKSSVDNIVFFIEEYSNGKIKEISSKIF